MRAQVLPERYGGAARLVPVDEAVAAARAAAAGAECGERGEPEGAPAAANEGRLAAAKAALRRWASAGWGAAQRPLRVRSRPGVSGTVGAARCIAHCARLAPACSVSSMAN